MNAPLDPPALAAAVLADVPATPAQHLRLALYGVVARIVEACAEGDVGAALQAHPFLGDYVDELQGRAGPGAAVVAGWAQALAAWEHAARRRGARLPLLALRDAGLEPLEIELLLAVGLIEEDPRFGTLFERAQRHARRPGVGLLMAWWRDGPGDEDRAEAVRAAVQRLLDLGLLQLPNPEAPRADWTPAVRLPVWDALRGQPPALRWLVHQPLEALPPLADYVAPACAEADVAGLPALLAAQPQLLLLLRGPAHNGRGTLAGALARTQGRALLRVRETVFEDESRWQLLGVLALLAHALPVLEATLGPGEARLLPPLPLLHAPLLVVTGRHGAWSCADARPVLAVELPLPAAPQRARHWQAALPALEPALREDCAAQMRLTSGGIRASAAAALGLARLAGRAAPTREELRRATRTLQSARLETLATRLEAGALQSLAVDESTREELDTLRARCRWREPLAAAPGAGGVGVRALFGGPSGTGKTLAARCLAAELGKDLWRIDLAATVNKYLGETEKNLDRALAAAEELDVVLLLDEGDALMASRTDVGSSNDRYANLETNFLLQRIEFFEGILLVTTNAPDRIDRAFARRMDVVVNFRVPDEWQRYLVLCAHLGDAPGLDAAWLQEVAQRCALGGGQWRNVALHARLLALQDGRPLDAAHLLAALQREYRKSGALCPLRPPKPARLPHEG